MAQRINAYTSCMGPEFGPSSHIRCLTVFYNSSSKGLSALFVLHGTWIQIHIFIHEHTFTHKIKKKLSRSPKWSTFVQSRPVGFLCLWWLQIVSRVEISLQLPPLFDKTIPVEFLFVLNLILLPVTPCNLIYLIQMTLCSNYVYSM